MNDPQPEFWQPPPADPLLPGRPNLVLRLLIYLGLAAGGYALFATVLYLFQLLGDFTGQSWFGLAGLALNAVVLAGLVYWLNLREHPLSGTLGPLLALLLVFLLFAVADYIQDGGEATFWSLRNVRTIAVQASTIAVAALGMTIIIIGHGIDLSAGTMLAMCATVMAYCLKSEALAEQLGGFGFVAAAITACVFTGVIAGAINGGLVGLLRVVPFIITLGTMSAFLGFAKILANETTVRPPPEAVPSWLPEMVAPSPTPLWIAWPLLPNFGWGVWLCLGLAVLVTAMLELTVFGRHVFALGSNEQTARLCGIHVTWTKLLIYTLGGLFVGIAGIYQFARLSSGNPTSGIGMELKVIAAVVIGGGSLSGGRGSIVGTLCGAAIMLVIASGCTSLDIQNPYQDIILGVIIVAAVTLDQFRQGKLALPTFN